MNPFVQRVVLIKQIDKRNKMSALHGRDIGRVRT